VCRTFAVGLAVTAAVLAGGCAAKDSPPRAERRAAAPEPAQPDRTAARRMRDAIDRLGKRAGARQRTPDRPAAAHERPVATAGAPEDTATSQAPQESRPVSSIGIDPPQPGRTAAASPDPPQADPSDRLSLVDALGGPVGTLAALAAGVLMVWWAASRRHRVRD
jgi:hypothetical protein